MKTETIVFGKGPPPDDWDRQIIQAIKTAERMASLHNTPCNIISGPGRDVRVYPRLVILTQPGEVVLETVYPARMPYLPYHRSSNANHPRKRTV